LLQTKIKTIFSLGLQVGSDFVLCSGLKFRVWVSLVK
jgi:hypothetical protein